MQKTRNTKPKANLKQNQHPIFGTIKYQIRTKTVHNQITKIRTTADSIKSDLYTPPSRKQSISPRISHQTTRRISTNTKTAEQQGKPKQSQQI